MRRLSRSRPRRRAPLSPPPAGASRRGRPVALVTAETSNEVLAVSLGKYGGHVLRRVHLADPLMIAAPLHGPAVVVSPRRHGDAARVAQPAADQGLPRFRDPEVARIAPGRTARLRHRRRNREALGDRPRPAQDRRTRLRGRARTTCRSARTGRRLWIALGETATTVVRLDTSNPRQPRVIGRLPPAVPGAQRGLRAGRPRRSGSPRRGPRTSPATTPRPGSSLEVVGGRSRRRRTVAFSGARGPAHERLRLVAHRGCRLADRTRGSGTRSRAVRLVQPRHVRRLGRDVVALHRPGDRARGPAISTASGR